MFGDQPHLRGEQKSEKIVQHGETVYTMTRRWENRPQNIYTILLSNFNWGAKASVKVFFSTCFQHQMTEKSPLQSELDVQTIKLGPSLFFLFLRCNSSALILFMVPQYLQWYSQSACQQFPDLLASPTYPAQGQKGTWVLSTEQSCDSLWLGQFRS